MINHKKKITLYDIYNYHYMVSLHNLINFYDCKWEFLTINEKIFLNGTNLKYNDFSTNEYLRTYKEEKIKLAEDILSNGMYFPYFIYGLPEEQEDEKTASIALGKHRYYSKLIYQKKNGIINNKFLFIYVPNEFKKLNIPHGFQHCFYAFNEKGVLTLRDTIFTVLRRDLIKYFDTFGGQISTLLVKDRLKTNPILNDEKLFTEFISSPLDENNILFSYYTPNYLT